MKILVAEDDRVVSTLICGLLRQRGHVPMPAFDSMQALMIAMRAPHPDLIILDIGMPGGTGIETLKRLKASARTNTIPVIVVSGTTDPTQQESVIQLGAEAFFAKPIEAQPFCEAVDRFGPPAKQ